MFRKLRFLSAGESHGPEITAVLEGIPAGMHVDRDILQKDMQRRQNGCVHSSRLAAEHDKVEMSGGVVQDKTTGAPIVLRIVNVDYDNWRDRWVEPMVTPRPGQVDYAASVKYRYEDLRYASERGSARETAVRVAAGSLCKQLLALFNIRVGGWVSQISSLKTVGDHNFLNVSCEKCMRNSEKSRYFLGDFDLDDRVSELIQKCMARHDTLGGTLTTVALNVPVGLGSHVQWDRRLDAVLSMALVSIQGIKGVEIGPAFNNSKLSGTQVHDSFFKKEKDFIDRTSNRAGGVEGGISNGQPIVANLAMKPISTTLAPQQSVNLATFEPEMVRHDHSDFCPLPRVLPVAEAMMALVIADALLEKLGGDHIEELAARFEKLPKGRLSEICLRNQPWRFLYA